MHSLCKEILLGKGLRQKYLKMVFLYKEISVSQHKHIIRPLWNFFFLFHLDEMIPVVLIPLKILFSKLSVFHPNRRGQEKGPHTTLKHQGKFTFTVRGGGADPSGVRNGSLLVYFLSAHRARGQGMHRALLARLCWRSLGFDCFTKHPSVQAPIIPLPHLWPNDKRFKITQDLPRL